MSTEVIQWAKDVVYFSSQYGSETSISYTVSNLAGSSNIYPKYGDFTQAAVMRTYGPWWKMAPSAPEPFKRTPPSFHSQDFVELLFEIKVYPIWLYIYETYNPGAVVKILASDTHHSPVRWVTLWEGKPLREQPIQRIFSPPLKQISFPINVIRLELNQKFLEYYTELDAVKLCGSKIYIPDPSRLSETTTQCSHRKMHEPERNQNLICMSEHQGCVHAQVATVINQNIRHHRHSNRSISAEGINSEQLVYSLSDHEAVSVLATDKITRELACLHLQDGLSAALDVSDNGYFDALPEEVIQLIISYLDLPSLCSLAMTCYLFNKSCYDSRQYTELSLQPYWTKVTDEALDGLQMRCKRLQRFNLAWCGGYGNISTDAFIRFMTVCPSELTSLYLGCCRFVDNKAIQLISENCKVLQEFDLQCNKTIDNENGFLHIRKLTNLRRLNLYRTVITSDNLIEIIRSCHHMEHLNLGACTCVINFDEVALALGQNCKNLKSLDVWRARTLTEVGLHCIANNCILFEELDAGWCSGLRSGTGCLLELVHKCPRLRKLFLTANRTVCDGDLFAIAQHCRDLEQLDILGTREVSQAGTLRVLENCKKLKFFDVSFCSGIDFATVHRWETDFPHVSIKKSFQT